MTGTTTRGMTIRKCGVVIIGMLSLLPACEPQSSTGQMESDLVPELSLAHELRIDGEVELFADIRAVIADEDGRIYVANDQYQSLHEIIVFDADGGRERTIGRRGEGPGEFGSLMGLAWAGDHLLTVDGRLQRFSFFDQTGGFVRNWTWDRMFQNAGTPPLMSSGTTGYALVNGLSSPVNGGQVESESVYLVFGSDSTPEILPRVSEPEVSGPNALVCLLPDRRSTEFFPLPFFDGGPLRAFLPEGRIALGHRNDFRIDILDLQTQELVKSFTGPESQIPMSVEVWEEQPEIVAFRDRALELNGDLFDPEGGGACTPDTLRPEFLPVMRTIFSDEEGRIWVESTGSEVMEFNLSVFSPDGVLIGRTEMPDRDPSVLPFVRRDRLYLVSIDSLEVQSIEVFKFEFP